MKKVVFLLAVVGLVFTSCKKETIEPIEPTPAVVNPADTTGNGGTTSIDYGNDNDGMQLFPQFAFKICGAGFTIDNNIDSIVFTNYTKNYVKVKTSADITGDPYLNYINVTSPSNGRGIGYSIPEAIIESNDSCNISVYFNADLGQYGYSEMGFTTVSLISEYGSMVTPTHYSHTDHY